MSISARDRRMYELAVRLAEDSDCNDKHGAVIAEGSRILCVAVNRQEPDRAIPDGHAEVRALWPYRDGKRPMRDFSDKTTLYSARFNLFPISKPCEDCQAVIRRNGILRVVYSDGWSLQELR